jgi:hypothetical protein
MNAAGGTAWVVVLLSKEEVAKVTRYLRESCADSMTAEVARWSDPYLISQATELQRAKIIEALTGARFIQPVPKVRRVRCVNCGREKGHHQADTHHCPIGAVTRVGHIHFDRKMVFTPKG